ncbi:MAG: type III-B CRISPR module-associated protein Cmr5 [Hyphomicrobiaceae bacterium]
MMRASLSELCAAHALVRIGAFRGATEDDETSRRAYVRLVERFAPLVGQSGLLQAAAWLDLATAATSTGPAAQALRSHLRSWFESRHPAAWQEGDPFAKFLLGADERSRAVYHVETTMLAQWLKTFAESELKTRAASGAPAQA